MPRIDLYTAIHKSLRVALFHLVERAGATDLADAAETDALGAQLADVVARLRAHRRHEDTFIHPVLAARAPELDEAIAADHAGYDGELDALEAAFAAACTARTPEAALAFYRVLTRLVAANLAHFDEEERGMAVLWERCTDAELGAIMGAFQASRTPAESMADLAAMLPALSHPERAAMLRGVPEAARPMVREVAGRVLGEGAREKLVGA